MNFQKYLLCFCFLCLFSCKESRKPGIETSKKEEAVEIEELTSAATIKTKSPQFLETLETIELLQPKLTNSVYANREYEPVWTQRAFREDLYRSIENAKEDGLEPKDYHLEYLKESLSHLSALNEQERSSLEIILTDAFLSLTSDYSSGKLEPSKMYKIWGVKKNKPNLPDLLQYGLQEQDIIAAVDSVIPKHPVYLGLKKSLKEYQKLAEKEEDVIQISEKGKSIKPGEKDSRIPNIKKRLKKLGFWNAETTDSLIIYDKDIVETIVKFQERNGIETDGVIGKGTIKTLNKTYSDRARQIKANLERWRWYPRDLGSQYIIVNIANYRLSLVKDSDTIATHRTMVGTEARKTPVFSDEVEHLVYNPTWTIPPTIKRKDVIPSAAKDPEYINRKNFSIFNRQGKRLDPHEIDWSSAKVRSYTFRQEAGSSNPLGLVKIIYPNPHLIYLHDTPSKNLFNKNLRAQSSGCVRVEGVLDLAKQLLSDQEKYSEEKIQEILDSGKTTTIKVTQKVLVHHFYWTAWREAGKTHFAEDIYKRDETIYKLLIDN